MKTLLCLFVIAVLSGRWSAHATDSDEFIEADIAIFDSHWSAVKIIFLGESTRSWDDLRSEDPDTAYHIARFWLRKADMATAEYQKLIYERVAAEPPARTDAEKEARKVKYHGAIPEAFRCYYYDNAGKIEAMLEINIKRVRSANSRAIEPLNAVEVEKRKAELQRLRDDYFKAQQEPELPKATIKQP